jgi:hypothetical protein
MRRNTSYFILGLAGVAIGVVLARGVSAQAAAPQERDILPALLTEVRGLRVAMEQMAAAGPRVQLAFGRLQLQEQRVNNGLRRLEAVRASLANAQREETEWRRRISSFEEETRSTVIATGAAARLQQEVQIQREQELQMMKQRHPLLVAEVQRLQVEESGIAQEIATEQMRWTDINQKLEELERSLSGGR